MFVGFGKGKATRQPQQHVVVKGAALLELSDPDVAHAMAATLQPLPDVPQQGADVVGVPALDLAVGQGQHGRLEALMPQLVLVHARGR